MKKRRISKIAVSLILTLSMLLSLPLYLCAADSHPGRAYDTTYAVYPTAPYTYSTHPSPDGSHYLRVRHNVVDGVTYYDEFAIVETAGNVLLRAVDLHVDYGMREGVSQYDPLWSPDGRFVVFSSPEDGYLYPSVRILDVKECDYWIPPASSDLYRELCRTNTLLPEKTEKETKAPLLAAEWISDTRLRLVTEYVFEDQRIWGQYVFDAAMNNVISRDCGDALDLDDPKNPVWKRTEALLSPDNNQGYQFDTPDNRYRITVETAYLCSNPETWNHMYESIRYSENGFRREEYILDTMHAAWTQGALYYDRPFWNHLSLKVSSDSRYLIAESSDVGAYPFYIDLDTGKARILPSAETRLDAVGCGTVKVYTEAFSVFGDALVIVCEEDGTRSREIFDLETGKIVSAQAGMADDTAFAYTEHKRPSSLRDAFQGFTAVSKTHANGLDGLFRIEDDYMYLHMEHGENLYSTKLYREYVQPVSVIDTAFEGYRVLYSREGCWVLDENETTVYAGTGIVKSCGAFVLAVNQDMINPIDSIVTDRTLFDADFHFLVKHVLDTAPQPDGSVYVSHTVGRGAFTETCLSHIAADGTVTRVGAYDGDLSEFREG
ncbi:MAG: hypothetical protein IJW77_00575 [Clostridia bacterium]|nr:hypothetical protein [Clostridia bacterium]